MFDDLVTFAMYILLYLGANIFLFVTGLIIVYSIYTLNAEAVSVLGNFFK